MKILKIFLIYFYLFLSACSNAEVDKSNGLGAAFYNSDITTQGERFMQLPLEQQWQIYYYGRNNIIPADASMAKFLAKKGELAVNYIFGLLDITSDENDYYTGLYVIKIIDVERYYDICGNPDLMTKLKIYQTKIRSTRALDLYNIGYTKFCE